MDKYLSVIEYMKKIIKESDKKYYVFVVGKLNIAKLANFPDVSHDCIHLHFLFRLNCSLD